jgi:uncharacterized membrane protein
VERNGAVTIRMTILRSVALAALALCSASLVDAVIAPTFCSFRSDCGEVNSSIYGRPLGVPLPVFGLIGFAAILCLSLSPNRRVQNLVRLFSVLAGLAGAILIVVQVLVLDRLCWMCTLVDAGAVILSLIAAWRLPAQLPGASWLSSSAWMGGGIVAVLCPLIWAAAQYKGPPPPQVMDRWVAGKVNVVELTDFDCPHCAVAEQIVSQALRDMPGVNFVRIAAPMPKHPNARPAARAYLAAARQGRGDEMASKLLAASSRTAKDCRSLAAALGLEMKDYDRVVADEATDAELDATLSWAQRAGPGLPMLWVQNHFFPRTPSLEELQHALDRAIPYQPRQQ